MTSDEQIIRKDFQDYRLEEFDRFVINTKILELLDRHGIKPTDIWSGAESYDDEEGKGIILSLNDRTISYPDGSTPTITKPEHHERLKRLRADLGMVDKEGADIDHQKDTRAFRDYSELYDVLCNAIEKAPKSFTRFR